MLLGVWSLVLNPMLGARSAHLARLADLDRISALLDSLPQTLTTGPATDLPPLRQRVTQSAAAAALEIRRLDPQGNALSVSLGDVGFSALAGWLDILTTAQAVQITGAEIARRPEPGIVSARLVLESLR